MRRAFVTGLAALAVGTAGAQGRSASDSYSGEVVERAREAGRSVVEGGKEAASAVGKGAREVGGAVSRTAREVGKGAADAAEGAWDATKKGARTVGAAASAAVNAARREIRARHGDGAASSAK